MIPQKIQKSCVSPRLTFQSQNPADFECVLQTPSNFILDLDLIANIKAINFFQMLFEQGAQQIP